MDRGVHREKKTLGWRRSGALTGVKNGEADMTGSCKVLQLRGEGWWCTVTAETDSEVHRSKVDEDEKDVHRGTNSRGAGCQGRKQELVRDRKGQKIYINLGTHIHSNKQTGYLRPPVVP